MTISVITSLYVVKDIGNTVMDDLQGKVDISVYFKYETPEENILSVKDQIEDISEVKAVAYVSKEKAFEVFSEDHKDDPVLMESLDEVGINPFLAALNIKAFQASQYEAVSGFLSNSSFSNVIERIDYHQRKPVIERVFSLTEGLNRTGILLSILFAVVAVLVAFNAIRISIYNSREEIKIQRLVGASNWFIRGPFLVQGALIGSISALISFLLFAVISIIFNSYFEFMFSGMSLFSVFLGNLWVIISIQVLSGLGLGMLSSWIAIRRYLRV